MLEMLYKIPAKPFRVMAFIFKNSLEDMANFLEEIQFFQEQGYDAD